MSTRHRNAGGPFTIFNPGLGVTGSLLVEGNASISGSLQLVSPGFLHDRTSPSLAISQKEQDAFDSGLFLFTERYSTAGDAYFGLFISSGSNHEQTPATPESAVTVNMLAGIRGSAVGKSNAFSFKTQDSASEVQRVRIQETPALQVTGSFQNNGNASVTGSLSVMRASSQGTPQLTIHENDTGYGRIEFQNTADTNGPNSLSHEWALAGLPKAEGTQTDARFNIWYGDQDGSGGGADVLSATGKGNILMPYTCFVSVYPSSAIDPIATGTNDQVFNSEHFDNQSAYDTSTGIFTAPVTGYYLSNLQIALQKLDADSFSYFWVGVISTGTPTYGSFMRFHPNEFTADTTTTHLSRSASSIFHLEAGETLKIQTHQQGGTAQAAISGNVNGSLSTWQIRLLG